MKKKVLIGIGCAVVALVIGLVAWLVFGNQPEDTAEEPAKLVTIEGEITDVKLADGGYLLEVATASNMDGVYNIRRFRVDDSTELTGEFMGFSLQKLLQEQVAGAFVSIDAVEKDVLFEGQPYYPATSITVIEESGV